MQNRCLLRGNPKPPFPFCGDQVLTGRQQQIQEKIEQNRRAQEESLRLREQLIQSLEEARESARREKEESEELKSARKQELEAQVGPLTGRSSLSEGMGVAATGPAWRTLHGGGTESRPLADSHRLALPWQRSPRSLLSCWLQPMLHWVPRPWSKSVLTAPILFLSHLQTRHSLGHKPPFSSVPNRQQNNLPNTRPRPELLTRHTCHAHDRVSTAGLPPAGTSHPSFLL